MNAFWNKVPNLNNYTPHLEGTQRHKLNLDKMQTYKRCACSTDDITDTFSSKTLDDRYSTAVQSVVANGRRTRFLALSNVFIKTT
jgi:hypothetical protein